MDASSSWSFGTLVRDLLGSPLEVLSKQAAMQAAEQARVAGDSQRRIKTTLSPMSLKSPIPLKSPLSHKPALERSDSKAGTGSFRIGSLFGGSEADMRKQLREYEKRLQDMRDVSAGIQTMETPQQELSSARSGSRMCATLT
jgi:hypothetical protein